MVKIDAIKTFLMFRSFLNKNTKTSIAGIELTKDNIKKWESKTPFNKGIVRGSFLKSVVGIKLKQ